VQFRGGPAAVMGDAGRWGLKPATAGGCLPKNPGGKADFLRLIPEPEDLPGGFFVSCKLRLLLMVKGVPSEGWDSFFLWVFWFLVGAHLRVRPLKGGHMGPPLQVPEHRRDAGATTTP
jgi:hypothetical protein